MINQPPSARIAAFIPAYNAAASVALAVRSLATQTPTPLDVLVIDDASTDDTAAVARQAGAQVVSLPANSGRGAVRARAIELIKAEFVVSLDAGNRMSSDFVANALPYFDDPSVGAVVGHWWEPVSGSMARRWRARHLFKTDRQPRAKKNRDLATHGCILRRKAVLAAGNFDPRLRHSEDAALGWRMHELGWRILACPEARVEPQQVDPLAILARRYWRWHAGPAESWSLKRYFGMINNSICVMAPLDWRARDLPALCFTLLMPHWIALYTLWRKWSGRVQK